MFIETLHSLLMECFLIIVPVVLYMARPHDTTVFRNRFWFIAILVSSLLLCMSLPVRFTHGHFWDLREVPMIIGALYGGPISALVLFCAFVFYRLILGGAGVWGALITNTIMMTVLLVLRPRWLRLGKNARVQLASAVAIGAIALIFAGVTAFSHYHSGPFLLMMGLLALIQTGSVFLITFLIETFNSLFQLQAQLRGQQQHEERLLTEMAASVAHEMRNPLTAIKGFLQLVRGSEVAPEKQQEYLAYCLNEVQQCELVISEYITFAHPERGFREPLSLLDEITYVVRAIAQQAAIHRVSLQTIVAENIRVYGVREHFRVCLLHLCKNAIEAMEKGGILTVECTETNNVITIRIADTGRGMTASQLEQLGGPTYSTTTRGTGLGTMLAYRIVEAMGGSIDCTSTIGVGTTFIIRFPRAEKIHQQVSGEQLMI